MAAAQGEEAAPVVEAGGTTVADVVRHYIDARPTVRNAMVLDIVNFSALGRRIMAETGIDAEEAVQAACRRYRDEARRTGHVELVRPALRESRLDVRTNVGLLSYAPSWQLVERLAVAMRGLRARDERVHLYHGWEAFTIVADQQLLDDVETALGRNEPIARATDLTELNIHSRERMAEVPGFIAAVASALAEQDINLVDATTCRRDHLFLIEEKDMAKAIAVVQSLMGQ